MEDEGIETIEEIRPETPEKNIIKKDMEAREREIREREAKEAR